MKREDYEKLKVSLIVSTYNRPDALAVCIRSVFKQTRLPDEIIIGDDGSGEETREMIARLQAESPVPIIHVWQEDNGFRKAMMRNKSIAASGGDYIIETDGDAFMDARLVEDHLREAREGCYVKGGRCNLGPELTAAICAEMQPRHIHFYTSGIEAKRANAIHCAPLARYLAPRYRRNRSSALGCNMSYWRADIVRINGYDEYYVGWGGEDWDLGFRLQTAGLQKRYLKFAGLVFHLWHEDKFMYNKEKNINHSIEVKGRSDFRCQNGLDQWL